MDGRPDGRRVNGMETVLDFHQARINGWMRTLAVPIFELTSEECAELFDEANVFYRRLIPLECRVVPRFCLPILCRASNRYRDAGLRSVTGEQRPFSPAFHRRRSDLARQPLHCIHNNDARSTRPALRPTLGDGSEHGEERPPRR